ncbi:MAG: glycosyltransferase family 4 protein [Bryobacterales bacterium]
MAFARTAFWSVRLHARFSSSVGVATFPTRLGSSPRETCDRCVDFWAARSSGCPTASTSSTFGPSRRRSTRTARCSGDDWTLALTSRRSVFLEKVWPLVRAQQPDARLVVMGFSPSEKVERLTAGALGVELFSNVPDIRPVVCSAPVAIFPFVSGTGVKNKLLEGAAMARALIVSPMATDGLRGADPAPIAFEKPEQWCDTLLELWRNPRTAGDLGRQARRWSREQP